MYAIRSYYARIEQAARDISSAHATDVLPLVADVMRSACVLPAVAAFSRAAGLVHWKTAREIVVTGDDGSIVGMLTASVV